jgi:hypothetical protein
VAVAAARLHRSRIRLLGTILTAVRSQRHGQSYRYEGYSGKGVEPPLDRSAG